MEDRDFFPHSWGANQINDTTNYIARFAPGLGYGLPVVQPVIVPRSRSWPLVSGISRSGGRLLSMLIEIKAADKRTARDNLLSWFDPESETPSIFIIRDEDGTNPRYVEAICQSCLPYVAGEIARHDLYSVVVVVHGDVRWRKTTEETDSWSITATGDTKVIANSGTDDAYPALTVTPTSLKDGDSLVNRQFQAIRWRVDASYVRYPIDIVNNALDTATLVGAGKMQADCDDLRVFVDGVEVDRWLQDANDATTQVWINLDFAAKWDGTLDTAIAGAGAISSIVLNEDICDLPNEGIVVIGTEVFSYTSKNNSTKTLEGTVTRELKGSTAAAHAVDAVTWWCQHDVSIVYGDPTATWPAPDDDYKPIFRLDSTNTSWDYDLFGELNKDRPGAWAWSVISYAPGKYTAHHYTNATPWEEMGIYTNSSMSGWSRWKVINPCGITNGNFPSGEKYSTDVDEIEIWIYSGFDTSETLEATIAQPALPSTWEPWNENLALASGATWVSFDMKETGSRAYTRAEVGDVTLTLDSNNTPTVLAVGEQDSYALSCVITNVTTSIWITMAYNSFESTESIKIDTDKKTVTSEQDDTSQFQVLGAVDGRKDWLKLQPGNNTLRFDDVGTAGATIVLTWEERYY